jgi:hypothetical protein
MVRVRRWRVLLISLGATALVMSTALGAAASASVTTSSVLKAARAAISKQTGVHLVLSGKSSSASGHVIEDLGTKSGEETYSAGGASFTIKLTPTYVYFSGNSYALTADLGLTAAQANKVGNHWISIPSGSSDYRILKSTLTVPYVASLLPPAKGTTLSTTITDGVHLHVLKWTTAATASTAKLSNTMTFSAAGATLPVELIVAFSSGSDTTTFSKWGEHVAVSAPPVASTISYSKATS